MIALGPIILITILVIACLAILAIVLQREHGGRVQARLQTLNGIETQTAARTTAARVAQSALPKLGTMFIPSSQQGQARLKTRLIQAGLYRPRAMHLYLGVKVVLMVAPVIIGLSL